MVSTRGLRYKFSEGERVLCYEPDPTKAKVLYDSKVLEVIESKDKRGRRTVEYLIHFQGWNSSWDRCVSEDFVLKDTEENRQLQRDLAEKSQLQLGAYLYRRERKKTGGPAASSPGQAKRVRHGFDDDASSSSTQPEEEETGDTDSSSSSESGSSQAPTPPPHSHSGRAHISLPSALRDRLTFDYHLVVKRGRLSALPASPCVAEILESFVRWFARAGAWNTHSGPRARQEPPQRPDWLDVSCRINLVREVADGLRVYFDFILRGHLLYKQELNQYHEMCGKFLYNPEDLKMEPPSDDEETQVPLDDDLKSPKIPEYSHLPPDPVDNMQACGSPDEQIEIKIEPGLEKTTEDNVQKDGKQTRTNNVARRLRSHKSTTSQADPQEEPIPSTSTAEPRTCETHSSSLDSSGSSISDAWFSRRTPRSTASVPFGQITQPQPGTTRTALSLLLDKVAKWQVIPREGTEHLPSRLYGAIHLARLFVKLPDFLNSTHMPDMKLKMILKHIDMFVQYMDEHSEWFGELYYIADNTSRSH